MCGGKVYVHMEPQPYATPPKFIPALIVATPGALELLVSAGKEPYEYIVRHIKGEWGDVDRHDQVANEHALLVGLRVMSVFKITETETLWLITEGDRSICTLLVPDEY